MWFKEIAVSAKKEVHKHETGMPEYTAMGQEKSVGGGGKDATDMHGSVMVCIEKCVSRGL